MERGYIKLWRKSFDSAVFADPNLWRLWTLCLMKANFKESFCSVEGCIAPQKLMPGQFVTGRFALHKEFYPRKKNENKSPLTVWRWLQTLEKCGNLNIKTHSKHSVITIENWSDYQGSEQHVNNRRTTGEQQMNTSKECKESKEGKEYKGNPVSRPPLFDPFTIKPEWFSEQAFSDLVNHRRKKKSAESNRAYSAILKQIQIAIEEGFSVDDCVDSICSRDWKGFKADWMKDSTGHSGKNGSADNGFVGTGKRIQ